MLPNVSTRFAPVFIPFFPDAVPSILERIRREKTTSRGEPTAESNFVVCHV